MVTIVLYKLPSLCLYQRKHPPTVKVYYTSMKSSPLPLTLGKLDSFSIVEPEGNERQPYSTGVHLVSVLLKKQDPPESSWIHRLL